MREKPVTDTQPMSISMATPQGISLSIILSRPFLSSFLKT